MFCFVVIVNCCLLDINMVVENVFILCLINNVLCNVECYWGYIFFSGFMKEFYSCYNGIWIFMLIICKCMLLYLFKFDDGI